MPPDFVPAEFVVPTELGGPGFRLRPLAAEDNRLDYAAWTASMDHIHATPGFEDRPWPHPMTLDENLGDLRGHVEDFSRRRGFTYTVIDDATEEVIGCVYLYPSDDADFDVNVRSWVRADHADLDVPLYRLVGQWLSDAWPFTAVDYATR
jgi:Acetyltransferase (GNAT) domain